METVQISYESQVTNVFIAFSAEQMDYRYDAATNSIKVRNSDKKPLFTLLD